MKLLKLKCEKCGHEWIPRVENPVKCPKCGRVRGTSARNKKAVEAKPRTCTSARAQIQPQTTELNPRMNESNSTAKTLTRLKRILYLSSYSNQELLP